MRRTASASSDVLINAVCRPPSWASAADCVDDSELDWYSTRQADVLRCKLVCYSCPVRADCLDMAMSERDPWGVWGGLTVQERDLRALVTGSPLPCVLPSHGSNTRYVKHGCRCRPCIAAHRLHERARRAQR